MRTPTLRDLARALLPSASRRSCLLRRSAAIRSSRSKASDDGAHRTSRCTDDEDVCHLVFH